MAESLDVIFLLIVLTTISGISLIYTKMHNRKHAKAGNTTPRQEGKALKVAKSFSSMFSVLLCVVVVRSFVAEPYKIPSESMYPTLTTGDYVLVNRFAYGLRVPVLNTKFLNIGAPERGDVVVFKYPHDTGTNYIKRVVAVSGDKVQYINKTLYVNGKVVPMSPAELQLPGTNLFEEVINNKPHYINISQNKPSLLPGAWNKDKLEGNGIIVPEGQYFALGDNRDNSFDGRYWGFIPDEFLVGKAEFIWMNTADIARIGNTLS